MKTKELLLECKVKLGVQTDYKLAQALEIPRTSVHYYMHGERQPDAYAITRIALCLGRDPAMVMAEIEQEAETNPDRRKFWADFLAHAATAKRYILALTCGGILWLGGTGSTAEAAPLAAVVADAHNVALRRKRRPRKPSGLTATAPCGRFFLA